MYIGTNVLVYERWLVLKVWYTDSWPSGPTLLQFHRLTLLMHVSESKNNVHSLGTTVKQILAISPLGISLLFLYLLLRFRGWSLLMLVGRRWGSRAIISSTPFKTHIMIILLHGIVFDLQVLVIFKVRTSLILQGSEVVQNINSVIAMFIPL